MWLPCCLHNHANELVEVYFLFSNLFALILALPSFRMLTPINYGKRDFKKNKMVGKWRGSDVKNEVFSMQKMENLVNTLNQRPKGLGLLRYAFCQFSLVSKSFLICLLSCFTWFHLIIVSFPGNIWFMLKNQ